MGFATKSSRQGFASHRAHRFDFETRALSVAMPVLAYICRYSLEMSTKAMRDFNDFTHCARFHINFRL